MRIFINVYINVYNMFEDKMLKNSPITVKNIQKQEIKIV